MLAISVRQPFASLILLGHKQIETRNWPTSQRGPILIHASKSIDNLERVTAYRDNIRELLKKAGFYSLARMPKGVLLGTVEITNCVPKEECLCNERLRPTPIDEVCGDWMNEGFAWLLANPNLFPKPIRYPGNLNFFEVHDAVFNI